MSELTFEEAKKAMSYDPATGNLSRRCGVGKSGCIDAQGYRKIRVNGRQCYAHRLAWLLSHGSWPVGVIDHINGNKSDNRLENLRDVVESVNQQNRKTARGYTKDKSGWRASIRVPGEVKQRYLGVYSTEEQAHRAYLQAKLAWHPGAVA